MTTSRARVELVDKSGYQLVWEWEETSKCNLTQVLMRLDVAVQEIIEQFGERPSLIMEHEPGTWPEVPPPPPPPPVGGPDTMAHWG